MLPGDSANRSSAICASSNDSTLTLSELVGATVAMVRRTIVVLIWEVMTACVMGASVGRV